MDLHFTLPLDDAGLVLAVGGGKGASLGMLARAGFPVPAAFVVTTHAYQRFVTTHAIQQWAARAAADASNADSASLDDVSSAIRSRFAKEAMPPEIADAIEAKCDALPASQVAVRSSATTEDLPDLSFAGQHDTFLDVAGRAAVLDAVVRCWSSLWTARAIAYRNRHGVAHDDVRLAVVVQQMVPCEASGVLFTANPLTGKRSEHVIEAAPGLGEALVSGQIDPDRYVVDAATQRITSRTIADAHQALPDGAILQLSAMGAQAACLFGSPQDIEWGWAGDRLSLLQSRPITSLYPLPTGLSEVPLQALISIGAIQGMLEPFTPFGRDLFRLGASRVASLAAPPATPQSQRLLMVAGERLFINVTGALHRRRTRSVVRRAIGMVEPGIGRALDAVLAEGRLRPASERSTARVAIRILPLVARAIGNASVVVLWPDAGRRRIQRRIAHALAAFESECAAAATLSERLSLCAAVFDSVTRFGPVLMPGLAVGLGSLHALHRLTASLPGAERRVLDFTRGLPHNVTTEMDLALWQTAVVIQQDVDTAVHVATTDIDLLSAQWRSKSLPSTAQRVVDDFLGRFGMRGVAEIDIGRARWREDPRLLLQALKSYLQLTDPERAPDVVFRRGAASAAASLEGLAGDARRTAHGWIRARLVRFAGRRVRSLAGLRESPKFTVIRLMGLLRATLLESADDLVAKGALAKADDLFFLELDEARGLARGETRDWRALIAARRAVYAREQQRRQVPLMLLSDGVAHYAGGEATAAGAAATLEGTPVSAGVVEGTVRVVHDPHGARLEPGEILVCPGTDPAWTPLFLSAGGLVTEVGGLMTHGSVVAREYGIPAVVGVPGATTRLATGVRVRVDGGRGTVTLLAD